MLLHSFLFLASCFQFLTWSWWRSLSTTSIHLVLGRPLGLLPVIPPISTCFVILCSGSLCTCLNQRSLCQPSFLRVNRTSVSHWFPFFFPPSWALSFPKSPALLSLFGSFSIVRCHRGLLFLLSFYRYLILSSLICSAPKPLCILCPSLFFLESLFFPYRCPSVYKSTLLKNCNELICNSYKWY